jgi:hypothetical protein
MDSSNIQTTKNSKSVESENTDSMVRKNIELLNWYSSSVVSLLSHLESVMEQNTQEYSFIDGTADEHDEKISIDNDNYYLKKGNQMKMTDSQEKSYDNS